MQKIGLNESYGDVNQFLDKPFFPYRNFLRYHIDKFIHPLMLPLHYTGMRQANQVFYILTIIKSKNFLL